MLKLHSPPNEPLQNSCLTERPRSSRSFGCFAAHTFIEQCKEIPSLPAGVMVAGGGGGGDDGVRVLGMVRVLVMVHARVLGLEGGGGGV